MNSMAPSHRVAKCLGTSKLPAWEWIGAEVPFPPALAPAILLSTTAFNEHLVNNVRMLSLASGGGSTDSANSPTTSSQAAQLLHSHNIAWCSQDTHSTRCWRKSHVSYRIPLTTGGRILGIMEIGDLWIQSLKGRLLGLLNINSIEASQPAQSAWALNDVHSIGNSFCSCDNELVRLNSLGYLSLEPNAFISQGSV